MYYKRLIKKKQLIKFWCFLGKNINTIFTVNYQFLNILYNKNCLLEFRGLIINIQNMLPLFINMLKLNNTLLFISTKFFYCQTIYNHHYFSIIKKLIILDSGFITNFSVNCLKSYKTLDFYFNPSIIILFYLKKNNLILLESKKKLLPVISILSLESNSILVDYPFIINSLYFYTIFFFSKFFFKLILISQ